MPLPALPLTVAGLWARESVRQTGRDFEPVPPQTGPHGIAMAGEMVKLAIRVLRSLAPAAGDTEAATESEPLDDAKAPHAPGPDDVLDPRDGPAPPSHKDEPPDAP